MLNHVKVSGPLRLLGHVRLPINLSCASFVLLIWFFRRQNGEVSKGVLAFKYDFGTQFF